ncbi:MAG: alpha/beta fold hydrolase [Acidobacteriota bacterium]
MASLHCSRRLLRAAAALAFVAAAALPAPAQIAPPREQPLPPDAEPYLVFIGSRPIGREDVTVTRQAEGWLVRGSSRLGVPIDATARQVEIAYDAQWRPTRFSLDGAVRGQEFAIRTTFAEGTATSQITVAGETKPKEDAVAADTVVLPNQFLGSYAVLARRLVGAAAGATLRGYIAPQAEVPIRVDAVVAERVETGDRVINASRYALVISNPAQGDVPVSVWVDPEGGLLRMSVPSQMLELVREDISSAATRITSFSLPTDEPVRIPAAGFNLGATVAKPAGATGRLPALVLVAGSGPIERDGFVAGVPIIGQLAASLVDAGFLVVRYDKRGVGQSGGRTETVTLSDYAEDVRAILKWLERRKDVDKNRIGLVGHSEGALVALIAAERDKKVKALAMIAAPSTTGAELILEQQRHLLDRAKTPDAERQAKIELQHRIHDAILSGASWEGIPDQLRSAADTPWFQSLLAFDPARVMKDLRQPVLIVQGELDTQVKPYHADRLVEMAEARRRRGATVDLVKVPGVNHLLLPAKTGEVDEYATLPEKKISEVAATAIGTWMAKTLGSR